MKAPAVQDSILELPLRFLKLPYDHKRYMETLEDTVRNAIEMCHRM